MFQRLKNEVVKYYNNESEEWAQLIKNGYSKKWANEAQNKNDRYILQNLTPKKAELYQSGKITRTEAVKIAIKRKNDELSKCALEKLEKIERVSQAEDINEIVLKIEWKRSQNWGHNPTCEAWANGYFKGFASGCGYDKESASIAQALDQSKSILKLLYQAEEKRLAMRKSRRPSRCDFIGYGSGYGVLPYLEGGVGVSSHIYIFKKLGFECTQAHGKAWDYYEFKKGSKNGRKEKRTS